MKITIVITGNYGFDKIYTLSKFKRLYFENIFGSINGDWNDHNKAIDWIIANGKFISNTICVAPIG